MNSYDIFMKFSNMIDIPIVFQNMKKKLKILKTEDMLVFLKIDSKIL